jgi:crossover junction endodeoxyribonuclease RusA
VETRLMMTIELPYPPSVNHYWRRVGARTLISRQGRSFRSDVVRLLEQRGMTPLAGPLDVRLEVHPPDRRRRDLDNLHKSLLDALQHGGAYADDGQIDRIDTWRFDPVEGGKVVVRVAPFRKPAMRIDGWVILTKDGTVVPGSFRTELQYAFIAAREHFRTLGRNPFTLSAAQATLEVADDRFPLTNAEALRA